MHDHCCLVVKLASFCWTFKISHTFVRFSSASVRVDPLLLRQFRVCLVRALECNLASLNRNHSIYYVLQRAFLVFAVVVTHLISDSVSLLQPDSHSALLALLRRLALPSHILLSLSPGHSSAHLDSSDAAARGRLIAGGLRRDALLRVRVLQNVRLMVLGAAT